MRHGAQGPTSGVSEQETLALLHRGGSARPVARERRWRYPGRVAELDDPVVVAFPLRGEWTVEQTPAHRIPSHGTDVLGTRYAYDFVRTEPAARRGLRSLLVGAPTRDHPGWGEPVHAASDGEVVTVVDDVPEPERVHVLRSSWSALRNARRYAADPSAVEPRDLAGNHVVIAGAEAVALYAHLVPGSVTVELGQQIRTGDVLGRLGHSGNSTAPHLHFQLMDGPDARRAKGVPAAFADYERRRDGAWEPVHHGIPGRSERVRFLG